MKTRKGLKSWLFAFVLVVVLVTVNTFVFNWLFADFSYPIDWWESLSAITYLYIIKMVHDFIDELDK